MASQISRKDDGVELSMKIEYQKGNLFHDPDLKAVTHIVNAQGKMRSGFAKELRERCPEAYTVYRNEYDRAGLHLGHVIPAIVDDLYIFHLVGQKHYGYDGARYVSYDAIATGIETLNVMARELELDRILMPQIGSGLAGGKWSVIEQIITEYARDFQPVVYIFE